MLSRRLSVVRKIAVVLWSAMVVPAFAQAVLRFGEGSGEVAVPAHYVPVEDKDASLVVVSKPEGNVKIYFDLWKLDAAVKVTNPGEALVREQAEKKGKELKHLAGKVLFLDSGSSENVGGEVYVHLHWQVGFGRTLVVMSARVRKAARDLPDVQRFFAGDIEAIIASLRRMSGRDDG